MMQLSGTGNLVLFCLFLPLAGTSNTYTVTSTANTGAGSLYQAILDANGNSGRDTIAFDISGTPPHTITINNASPLPNVTDTLVIDGTTQPDNGFNGVSPKIILVRSGTAINGITIVNKPYCEIYGLYIKNFQYAIYLSSSTAGACANFIIGTPGKRNVLSGNTQGIRVGNTSRAGAGTIQANYIGVDTLGTSAAANSDDGIYFAQSSESGQKIGGSGAGEGNVISGNGNNGIRFASTTQTDHLIRGNYIGTNKDGSAAIANTNHGIYFANSSITGIRITGNVISGNGGNGIYFLGSTIQQDTIQGNWIGVDKAGTSGLGNGGHGIAFGNSSTADNVIGGSGANEGNIISDNTGYGIYFAGVNSDRNKIQGNYIGVDATGAVALGNGQTAIQFNGSSCDNNQIGGLSSGEGNIISASATGSGVYFFGSTTEYNKVQGNYIGTDINLTANMGPQVYGVAITNSSSDNNTIECNVIAYSPSSGVYISSTSSDFNLISRNSFFCNGSGGTNKGINLASAGNDNYAAPAITSANTTTVSGTAGANDTVEVYIDGDGCAGQQGKYYIGTTTANGSGNWSLGGTFSDSAVALARSPANNNTSEFSAKVYTGAALSASYTTCATVPGGGELPLVWLNVSAAYRNGLALISWTTASETNNDYFEVQRSFGPEWEALAGWVSGAGNSTSVRHYTFTDRPPDADDRSPVYYRIRQVDYDGAYSYSGTVFVQTGNRQNIRVIFVDGLLLVNFSNDAQEGKVVVNALDMTGRKVEGWELQAAKGNNTVRQESRALTAGIYLFRFSGAVSGQTKVLVR